MGKFKGTSEKKKKQLVEHTRRRYVKPKAPYQADRKANNPPSRDIDQKRFRCECRYCQSYMGNTSGISTSQSSSWDKLIQELNNLTLNPDTTQHPLQQERVQEREEPKTEAAKKVKGCFRGS